MFALAMFSMWFQIVLFAIVIDGLVTGEGDDRNVENAATIGLESQTTIQDSISYFIPSFEKVSCSDAERLCESNQSSLAVVEDLRAEEMFHKFIFPSNLNYKTIWTSRRNLVLNNWTWTSELPINKGIRLEQKVYDTHLLVALNKTSMLNGRRYAHRVYLCQYSGNQICQPSDFISWKKGRCVKESVNASSWHEARRGCLETGGDLAILNRHDIETLSSSIGSSSKELQRQHLLALETILWGWNKEDNAEYGTWSESAESGAMDLCVAYAAASVEWITQNCSSRNYAVCQKVKTNGSENDLTRISSAFKTSESLWLIIGVVFATVLGVTVILVIAIRYKKSHEKSDWVAVENINPINQFSAQFRDYIRGVYGMTQLDDSQKENSGSQPLGEVCAPLEFLNKDETGIPHMVGPLGDVYAMPIPKPIVETGERERDGKSQLPTKTGPLGDVYTLPIGRSVS